MAFTENFNLNNLNMKKTVILNDDFVGQSMRIKKGTKGVVQGYVLNNMNVLNAIVIFEGFKKILMVDVRFLEVQEENDKNVNTEVVQKDSDIQ